MQRRFGVTAFCLRVQHHRRVLWTSRVTSHVPVREVAALISAAGGAATPCTSSPALRRAGIARPRIAVSGLNPHAGDGGSIGSEEIEVIGPAVEACAAKAWK